MNQTHATFIVLSYGIAAFAVLATIATIMIDYRNLRRGLERLGAPVDLREDEA
jgi:heme exporter protein CcmD